MIFPQCSHDVPMMFLQINSLDIPMMFLQINSLAIPILFPCHALSVVLLFPFHFIFISFRIIIFWTRDVGTCNGMWLQLPIMPGALPSCHMRLTQRSSLPSITSIRLQVPLWNTCMWWLAGRSSKILYYVLLHLKEFPLLFPLNAKFMVIFSLFLSAHFFLHKCQK